MTEHASDCAIHDAPAYVPGNCDCGAMTDKQPDPSLEASPKADQAEINSTSIRTALALAQSVIKCGEPWTDTCEKTFGLAFGAVEALRIENKNLKRIADAKPEEMNQELLDENQALRECVTELEGKLWRSAGRNRKLVKEIFEAKAHATELAGALKWFDLHADGLAADLRSAHHYRGEGGSQWMAGDDRELRADFRKAVEQVRTALAARPVEALVWARALWQFIDDFESQFVCWGMMNLKEQDEAVQRFVERAAGLAKPDALDRPAQGDEKQ